MSSCSSLNEDKCLRLAISHLTLQANSTLNCSECQADFTYTASVKAVKFRIPQEAVKSVAEDLEAVLRKIEGWHQGSIGGFRIIYRDFEGHWNCGSAARPRAPNRQLPGSESEAGTLNSRMPEKCGGQYPSIMPASP